VLRATNRSLQTRATELEQSQSFDKLHESVARVIGSIHGIGPLTVYDVATRIGAYLDLEPERVYLHAGTAAGTKAMGLANRGSTLEPVELPAVFRRLRPPDIENCLCLYMDHLAQIRAR
jgi:hypothetical protein